MYSTISNFNFFPAASHKGLFAGITGLSSKTKTKEAKMTKEINDLGFSWKKLAIELKLREDLKEDKLHFFLSKSKVRNRCFLSVVEDQVDNKMRLKLLLRPSKRYDVEPFIKPSHWEYALQAQ